jgi:hypothetical protein
MMERKAPAMWQPIETAPISRFVLMWWRPLSDPRYPVPPEAASTRSNNRYAETCVIGSIVDPKDFDAKPSQWWDGKRYQDIWHVTHWQPLPEPPQE